MKKIFAKLGLHSKADLAAFCKQFIKFGMVGLLNTAITLAAQYALMALRLHYVLAYILAFLLGVVNSFFWNSRYVFHAPASRGIRGFLRLLVSNSVTLLVGMGVLTFLVEILRLSENLAPLLNMAVTVPLNFLLTKYWAFRP